MAAKIEIYYDEDNSGYAYELTGVDAGFEESGPIDHHTDIEYLKSFGVPITGVSLEEVEQSLGKEI